MKLQDKCVKPCLDLSLVSNRCSTFIYKSLKAVRTLESLSQTRGRDNMTMAVSHTNLREDITESVLQRDDLEVEINKASWMLLC